MKPIKVKLFEDEEEKVKEMPELLSGEDVEIEEEEQALEEFDELLSGTPIMGEGIYSRLPQLMKRWVVMFDTEREKDMFITSALTAVGSYFASNTSMKHHKRQIYPCIFSCISASSGAGKSAVKFGAELLRFEDNARRANYKSELQEYKLRESDKDLEAGEEQPKHQAFLLPTNTTAPKMMEYIAEADKRAQGLCIVEEEMDELVNMLRSKHGDISPLLRKAFDFSDFKKSTKGDNQELVLSCPKIGVCMAGTLDQPVKFFSEGDNSTNGLLQRNIQYLFHQKRAFKAGLSMTDEEDKEEELKVFFQGFSSVLIEHGMKAVRFRATKEQAQRYEQFFIDFIEKHKAGVKDIESFTTRMASTCLRIIMTLSRLEKVYTTEVARFEDKIFDLGLDIFNVYAEHTIIAYKLLFKGGQKVNVKNVQNMSNEKMLMAFKAYLGGKEFKNKEFFAWIEGQGKKIDAKERNRLTSVLRRSKFVVSGSEHGYKKFI